MATLRIATFNVNGVRSRLAHHLQWLGRKQPDIVCLQELKASGDVFPTANIHAVQAHAWADRGSTHAVTGFRCDEPRPVRMCLMPVTSEPVVLGWWRMNQPVSRRRAGAPAWPSSC